MVIPVRGSMAQGGDGLYKPPAPPDMLPPSFHVEDYIHSPSTTLLYKFEDCLNTFNQYNGSSVNEANSPVSIPLAQHCTIGLTICRALTL